LGGEAELARHYLGFHHNAHMQSKGKTPDFFCLQETYYICRNITQIVPCNDVVHLVCDDQSVCAEWENSSCLSPQSDTFHQHDTIVFQLVLIAFADSSREIHFIPKKGKTLQSGRQAYFACKGQFIGVNTARLKCDLVGDIIQKMCYTKGSQGVGTGTSTAPSFTQRFALLMNVPLT
jgi:hypothetical protein